MRKVIFIAVVALGLFGIGYIYLSFTGAFDKKYTREWLVNNFVQNEGAFSNLVSLFATNIDKSKQSDVTFGLSGRDKVSLIIYPSVIDPANKIIGGKNLKFDSPELNSALTSLGWTIETVKKLKKELSQTNCDWIRVIATKENAISIYPDQNGWGSYSYVIFRAPITDTMIQTYGKPLSDSGFGKRVLLNYTTAL